jgi:two-component sensor histidine kinase
MATRRRSAEFVAVQAGSGTQKMQRLKNGGETGTSTLLLAEMAHRIGNEYTLAIASLSTASHRANSVEAKSALDDACQMLMYFADTHRALRPPCQTEPIDLAEYLRELCRSLSRSRFVDQGVTLGLIGRSVAVAPERAWRVALIISELVVNSLRHAFTDHRGRIIVEIDRRGDAIECIVADDGRAAKPATPGYGTSITEALAGELGGQIEREFDSRGGRVRLSFPVRSADSHGEAHLHSGTSFTPFLGASELG